MSQVSMLAPTTQILLSSLLLHSLQKLLPGGQSINHSMNITRVVLRMWQVPQCGSLEGQRGGAPAGYVLGAATRSNIQIR